MMNLEDALKVARALPTPTEAAHAAEALPETIHS
jgi:hypothetical protein